jgi:NitT/TauT family transport system substrate-binding protein
MRWQRAIVLGLLVGLAAGCAGGGSGAPAASGSRPAEPSAAGALATSAPAPAAGAAADGTDAGRPRPEPLPRPLTVRFANAGIAAQAPTFLGIERGYFKELGIEIHIENLTSSNDMVALLSSDQLDVGHQAIAPAMFNAVARGVAVRMVADHGGNIPGRTTPSLAIRTDLLEQAPWTGYERLKGMKMAVQGLGSLSEWQVEQMLARGGLQPSDVDLVSLTFPDMAVAFSNRALDAAIFNEPWATQLEEGGVIKKVVYTDDIDPNGNVSGILFSETFAQNTPAARNYMVAVLRGVRDYWDAYDGRQPFEPVVEVLQKYTGLKDEALIRKIPPTGQNPNGYLNLDKIGMYEDWFVAKGLVPQRVDPAKLVDHSFIDYANSVLGPYQPVENPRRPPR